MNGRKAQAGFTLLETLLYVAIVSVVLFASTIFLHILLESRIKNQAIAEVEQQGVRVMRLITQSLRNGDFVKTPEQGRTESELYVALYPSGSNQYYVLSDGVIRMREGEGDFVDLTNARVIASEFLLENLSLPNTPGVVRIRFTLTHANPENRNEYMYSKTFTGAASLRQH